MLKTNQPILAIIAIVLLWSSSYVAIRIGLVDFTPGAMALLRYLVASVVLLPFYLRRPNRTKVRMQDLPVLFLLGAIGIGVYNVVLNIGELTVSASMTGFIIAQVPVVAILLANVFLKERLALIGWIGIVISIFGIFLISFGVSLPGQFNHGVWFLLIASACGGVYSVSQKPLMLRYRPMEVTTFSMWFGTICLLGWAPSLFHELHTASVSGILWVVYLGVFPAAFAYFCWAHIVKCMTASKAVSYLYLIPGISMFFGWLVLDEVPSSLALLGAVLAMAGAIMVKVKK